MIVTQNLLISPVRLSGPPEDTREYAAIIAAFSDPSFYYAEFKAGLSAPDRQSEIRNFLLKYADFESLPAAERHTWGFFVYAGEDFIGFAELEDRTMNNGRHEANFGIFVLPGHQKKGYAAEISAALFRWAFEALKLDGIHITINPQNRASIATFTRNFPLISHGPCANKYAANDGVAIWDRYYLHKPDFQKTSQSL